MSVELQFTARKRSKETGEPWRWRHSYASRESAERARAELRKDPRFRGKVRIEIGGVR